MSVGTEHLKVECQMMARHLIGDDPTTYVTNTYAKILEVTSGAGLGHGIDRPLLRIARMGRWGSALADSYSGLFVRTGLTRTRFVLLYSILESSAPYHATLDRVPRGGFARLIGIGIVSSATAAIATILFGPIHLVVGGGKRSRGDEDA